MSEERQWDTALEELRARLGASEALCGDALEALRWLVVGPDEDMEHDGEQLRDCARALLATDAARKAQAKREWEQAVIEAAREVDRYKPTWTAHDKALAALHNTLDALAAQQVAPQKEEKSG